MEENSCGVVFVLANMIHQFQPLDRTVSGIAKKLPTTKFEEWYAKEIVRQINARVEVYSVEIKILLSVLKQVHARWLICLYDHLRNQSDLTKKDSKSLDLMKQLLQTLNKRTLSSILIQIKINERQNKTI